MRARRLLLMAGLLLLACSRKPQGEPEIRLPELRVLLSGPVENDVVRRPWLGPIIQVLAEDAPDNPAPLRQKQIAGSSMTADALFERALANLRTACPQPIHERTVKAAKARVQITQFPDIYTAARLQLPDLWSKIAADAGGHLYAAAPVRDIVVWTTSDAKDDQLALRAHARTAFRSRSHPISPAILRWTGRGWSLEDETPPEP